MSDYKYLNADQMRSHFAGDEEMIGELIEIFEQTYGEILSEVERSLKAKDMDALEHSAHTLKGMIANLFAKELIEDAFTLEKMGRDKKVESTGSIIEELKVGIPELIDEVKAEFKLLD